MPMMPRRLPQMRWPSIEVGLHPAHVPLRIRRSPSVRRRGTARMRAMVMSAVSSVSTPGVLVTVMLRWRAVFRSIWSTPVPKEAMSRSRSPAWESTDASRRSVTVGTSTSQVLTAAMSWAWDMGLSARLRRTSNSSIIRVSMESGSLRVTTTTGLTGIRALSLGVVPAIASAGMLVQRRGPRLAESRPRGLTGRAQPALGDAMQITWRPRGLSILILLALMGAMPSWARDQSGLPVPRYVSLRSNQINLRSRPGMNFPIQWVYQRKHMPVEIIAEFDTWRKIRDWQGTSEHVGRQPLRHDYRKRADPASGCLRNVTAGGPPHARRHP